MEVQFVSISISMTLNMPGCLLTLSEIRWLFSFHVAVLLSLDYDNIQTNAFFLLVFGTDRLNSKEWSEI